MDATATIAQLGTARQQAERADYRGALRNFDAVLLKLQQCAHCAQTHANRSSSCADHCPVRSLRTGVQAY